VASFESRINQKQTIKASASQIPLWWLRHCLFALKVSAKNGLKGLNSKTIKDDGTKRAFNVFLQHSLRGFSESTKCHIQF
jgi:hypothetical protein